MKRIRALTYITLPHHFISRLMYRLARVRVGPIKNLAIKIYTALKPVNMSEAVDSNPYAYESLNAFFTRALKPECRPIYNEKDCLVCPVDGSVSEAGRINRQSIFQAKGREYSLNELLIDDGTRSNTYENGAYATLYLSPKDYHRIHMPADGKLLEMKYVPGRLFSVAEHTVAYIPRLFARNERVVCHFDTEYGPITLVLVGAMNVSAIDTVWHGPVTSPNRHTLASWNYKDDPVELKKGEEMGRFNLGSTVIVLGTSNIEWVEQLTAGESVRMGEMMGQLKRSDF